MILNCRNSVFCIIFLFLFTPLSYSQIPDKTFIPYVDVNITNFSLHDSIDETGIVYYHLAFMLDEGNCNPAWGESIPLHLKHMYEEIQTIRSMGGDVAISFGGSLGTDLALGCSTVQSLQNAYQSVIETYDVRYLDFDVEGSDILDKPSVDRRNKAIAGLQSQNPDLKISFTLPVLPSGLVDSGLYLLENAIDNGVFIDVLNIMTMNYGPANAPHPDGYMGEYAIDAVISTIEQLDSLNLYDTLLGVTPMIGVNEIEDEIFYLSDGDVLIEFLENEDRVKFISMWSTTRDFGTCPGEETASPVCSGIEQNDYDFSFSFSTFGIDINQLPKISILYPLPDEIFTEGTDILIEAEAHDPDGTVSHVEFLANSVLLDTVSKAPYTAVFHPPQPGSYMIEAVATDNEGASRTATVNITVVAVGECTGEPWSPYAIYTKGDEVSHNGYNWRAKWWTQNDEPGTTGEWGVWEDLGPCDSEAELYPVIEIISENLVYSEGDTITVEAVIGENSSQIDRVEFYNFSHYLGTLYEEPFLITLYNLPAGEYSITAVAYDINGLWHETDPLIITIVKQDQFNCSDFPSWQRNVTYYPGDIFEYKRELYEVNITSRNVNPNRGLNHGNYSILTGCN